MTEWTEDEGGEAPALPESSVGPVDPDSPCDDPPPPPPPSSDVGDEERPPQAEPDPPPEPGEAPAGDPAADDPPRPLSSSREPLPMPPRASILRPAVVLVSIPILLVLVLALRPRPVLIYAHNGAAAPLEVSVDGEAWRALPPGQTERLEASAGRRTLRWRLVGAEPSEVVANLSAGLFEPKPVPYVWNVGEAQDTWWVVARGYGSEIKNAPRAEPFTPPAVVFRLPQELIPELDAPFPGQIREKKGSTGGIRRILWSDACAERRAPATITLFVDNRTDKALTLTIGGKQLTRPIAPTTVRGVAGVPISALGDIRAWQMGGEHSWQLNEVPDVRPTDPTQAWVWNVPGQPGDLDYVIVSQTYGVVTEPAPADERWTAPGTFFRTPDDVLPLVDRFPQVLQLPADQTGGVARVLFTPAVLRRAEGTRLARTPLLALQEQLKGEAEQQGR